MKKKANLVLSIVLVAVVVLCATVAIIDWIGPKKIKVGVLQGTPMAQKNEAGEWSGYEIDFATKMFTELGYKVEFVEVDAVFREKMLADGKIDCYMSGTNLLSDQRFLYSKSYIESKQVLFYKNVLNRKINENADLYNLRIGVLGSSENESSVQEYTPRETVLDFMTNEEMLEMLNVSNIDVAIIDYMIAENLVKNNEEYKDYIVGIIYDTNEHAIVMKAKDIKLKTLVDEKITEYISGNYFSALKKHMTKHNLQ